MKILITGAKGMLGTQVALDLKRGYTELGAIPQAFVGADVVLADIDNLDITDKAATEKFIADCAPDVVINCAAYTNVDGCESNQDTAFMVNGIGSRNLAIACENVGAKLVHVSTDYVFKGDEPTPRREYDVTNPISVYGKTKNAGPSPAFFDYFSSSAQMLKYALRRSSAGSHFSQMYSSFRKWLPPSPQRLHMGIRVTLSSKIQ